jgi:hypothetical protein
MSKSTIFISCGQFTDAEKKLGMAIAKMVKTLTSCEPFYAQDVQDLNGLDTNILEALRGCVGFITVMHARGAIKRPDGPPINRASVWIEQEIAIATYIRRVEKRALPIIAFKHESVGLEGIRSLLQLNPIDFVDETDVLAALPALLGNWKTLQPSGIDLMLQSVKSQPAQGHVIRNLEVILKNGTAERIPDYDCVLELPASLLKHWEGARNALEVKSADSSRRKFRMDEKQHGPLQPRDSRKLMTIAYCTRCADEAEALNPGLVASLVIGVTAWIGGREYEDRKTIVELAREAEKRGDT